MDKEKIKDTIKKNPAVCQVLIVYEQCYKRSKAREMFDILVNNLTEICSKIIQKELKKCV